MDKCAIFVEGQSEQIFVRELLLRRYCWDARNIAVRCYKLQSEVFETAEYDFGDDDAEHFYQIVDVGNDNKVLSAMTKRAPKMNESGFTQIVGLRDMYCRVYREMSPHCVSRELNEEFINNANELIRDMNLSETTRLHFAIMEVETWMLALLEKWKGNISDEDIALYFDSQAELENIFHPAAVMKNITEKTGEPYEKHKTQVNSIMSNIEWQDFQDLYDSNRCPSFNRFMDDILPSA